MYIFALRSALNISWCDILLALFLSPWYDRGYGPEGNNTMWCEVDWAVCHLARIDLFSATFKSMYDVRKGMQPVAVSRSVALSFILTIRVQSSTESNQNSLSEFGTSFSLVHHPLGCPSRNTWMLGWTPLKAVLLVNIRQIRWISSPKLLAMRVLKS